MRYHSASWISYEDEYRRRDAQCSRTPVGKPSLRFGGLPSLASLPLVLTRLSSVSNGDDSSVDSRMIVRRALRRPLRPVGCNEREQDLPAAAEMGSNAKTAREARGQLKSSRGGLLAKGHSRDSTSVGVQLVSSQPQPQADCAVFRAGQFMIKPARRRRHLHHGVSHIPTHHELGDTTVLTFSQRETPRFSTLDVTKQLHRPQSVSSV